MRPELAEGTTAPIRNCRVSATARKNLTQSGTQTVLTYLGELPHLKKPTFTNHVLWEIGARFAPQISVKMKFR